MLLLLAFRFNFFSGTQDENELNYKNLEKLKAFVNRSLENLPGQLNNCVPAPHKSVLMHLDDIPDLMKLLEHTLHMNKPKNVDIFPIAEKVRHGIFPVRRMIAFTLRRSVVELMASE